MYILTNIGRSVAQSWKTLVWCMGLLAVNSMVAGQALVTNNGTLIAVKPGAIMIVKSGTVHNAAGYISNEGLFTIEKDFVNDASAAGGDTTAGGTGRGLYRVQNNWVNNSVFIPDSGTVELYGPNQSITGTAATTFYDLKLTGTGIKTQTINSAVLDSLVLNDRELATDHYKMHVKNTDHGAISKVAGNQGFVSSLDSGRLAWDVDSSAFFYLFPTGSSIGTARYRPILIRPDLDSLQTFEVRFANVDPSSEGFDRATKQNVICKLNDKFYHLIGRSYGAASVQVTMLFDSVADGGWNMVAHWQNLPEWESIANVSQGTYPGFNALSFPGWNDFAPQPFELARQYPAITGFPVVKDLTCYQDGTGQIKISVNGGTQPYTYQWSPVSSSDSALIQNLQAGNYQVYIGDKYGCVDTSNMIAVKQPPQIQLRDTVNSVKCNSGSTGAVALAVDSAVLPIASYTWSNGSTTQNVSQLHAGTYSVTVTDNNACKRADTVTVPEPPAIDLTPTVTDLKCYQGADGQIDVAVSGGTPGTPPYSYQWNDSAGVNAANRLNLPAGTYHVTITDGNGCQDTASYTLNQPDSIIIKAGHDTIIAVTYSAPLDVISSSGGTGSISYVWTPGATLNDSLGSSVIATPPVTTTYKVTGTDINGCIASDTVHIRVDVNLFTVPDGFTPNGDGRNDMFAILNSPTVQVIELRIFNRWGQLLSENTQGWDGTFNGKLQPMDTYVYQATIRMPNGDKIPKSGDFILIR